MLLALGSAFFILGFIAAIIFVAQPTWNHKTLAQFLDQFNVTKLAASLSGGKQVRWLNHDDGEKLLLTKEQIERQYDTSSWQRLAYEDFKSTILATEAGLKTFPCVYATMGYRSNEHRYLFLNSSDPKEPQNVRVIGPALQQYLSIARGLGANTSLVIVCAPSESERSVSDYHNNFWDMLRGLRTLDPKPWPRDIPQATKSEKWTFCFDGQPIFPVMLTPAHIRRWSRHMSVPLIALQPKWVLDDLLSTPEKREAATGKVRKLLQEYDQIEISPDLTSYGQPGTTEARQLCLLDDNKTSDCPYRDLDR